MLLAEYREDMALKMCLTRVRRWTAVWQLYLCVACVWASPILPAHLSLKADSTADNNVVEQRSSKWGMRPAPSDDLPIQPLQYPAEDKHNVPSDADLDPHELQKILGDHFDHAFMASVRPLESILSPNGTYVYNFKKNRPDGEMPPELRKLSFAMSGTGKRIRIKKQRHRRRIRNYLWEYTYCPVHYRWKDLGARFWPRWIREGSCQSERSCSIPSGMKCQSRNSTTKTILWWHCRRRTHCRWISIMYPIVVDCACAC